MKTADHNYLLHDLASQNKLKNSEVIGNALRLYFKYEEDTIILSGVRKLDDEILERDFDIYLRLIKKKI